MIELKNLRAGYPGRPVLEGISLDFRPGEVLAVIAQVPDSRYRRLLRARYVEGKTWEEIAVDMGYNYQHVVQRLHPQALHAVEEIMR